MFMIVVIAMLSRFHFAKVCRTIQLKTLTSSCRTCKHYGKINDMPVCKLVKIPPTDIVLGQSTYASCYDERSEKGNCSTLGKRYERNETYLNDGLTAYGLIGLFSLWPNAITPDFMLTPVFIVPFFVISFSWGTMDLMIHYWIHHTK